MLLKCVNLVTFLQWKSPTLLLVHIKGSQPDLGLLHLAMITGCVAVFFHFPSSDFCLHDQHQLVIIVLYFKHGIKEMCYKDQMWLSQLSSSDIMWLHKPPTVSLLPLDTPRSWLKMVYKQNTCWKRGQRAQKKGALIKRSFSVCVCVCVWSMIGRIPQKKLWVADITTDHRAAYNVGFWLLGTSSEDIQRSWKLEIQSMSEKKKKYGSRTI